MQTTLLLLFAVIPAIALIWLWIYALVDLLRTPIGNQTDKLIWLVILIVASFLGSILWLFWGKNNTKIL